MKNLKYILLFVLPLFAFYSCENDDGNNPTFGEKDLPEIHMEWIKDQAYKLGESVMFNPEISPSDGAVYKWILDGQVIATTKDLSYELNTMLVSSTLEFEVVRNGVTNNRKASLVVVKDFVPKEITKKVVGFYTGAENIGDINWENISHLVVSSLIVAPTSISEAGVESDTWIIDESQIEDVNFTLITRLAHHYGVYVMLDVTGRLGSYLNAAQAYDSKSFYKAATGDKKAELIKAIQDKATAYGVDGVNLYMNKATGSGNFDPAKLRSFYEEFAEAAPDTKKIDGNDYKYLLTVSVYTGWLRSEVAPTVGVQGYDWVNIMGFGGENLVPGAHSSLASLKNNEIGYWLNRVPSNQVVLVVPAFGLQYTGKSDDYTWGNLGNYTKYMTYKSLCDQYSDAHTKNRIDVIPYVNGSTPCDVTYYDGLPEVADKAAHAITTNLGGLGVWSVGSDSKDASKSLTKKIWTDLGN